MKLYSIDILIREKFDENEVKIEQEKKKEDWMLFHTALSP